MKTTLKIFLTLGLMFVQVTISFFGADALAQRRQLRYREGVPMDSIQLSDPFILADSATRTYYMTGTGGLLWTSAAVHSFRSRPMPVRG